jgi:hypothetical protein
MRNVNVIYECALSFFIIIIILLTVIGLSPDGSTQSHTTIHSTTQIKIHRTTELEKKKNVGRVRAVLVVLSEEIVIHS